MEVELKMDLTVDDLRTQLKSYNYDTLTGGDDSVAQSCIDKAVIWAKAKLKNCGAELDLDDEVLREAVLKRALYELYSYAENEQLAADKKDDALELMRSYLGDCIDDPSLKKNYPPVEVALIEGSDNWRGSK